MDVVSWLAFCALVTGTIGTQYVTAVGTCPWLSVDLFGKPCDYDHDASAEVFDRSILLSLKLID